jgi:hypothetical protein
MYRDIFRLPLLDKDYPVVGGLAKVAADRARRHAVGDPLTPLYLRRPDATPPAERVAG